VKLIAITHCKYDEVDKAGKITQREAQPGEAFDVADKKAAEGLIAAGGAATPEDYERAKAASKTTDERVAELEAENAKLREQIAKSAPTPPETPKTPDGGEKAKS
jgi:hypothetical protein